MKGPGMPAKGVRIKQKLARCQWKVASLPFLEKANPKAAVQGQVDQVLQAQAPVALVAHVVHVALAVPVVLVASEKAL